MYTIICLVITALCLCLTADVTVYNSLEFNFSAPWSAEPRAVSQLPWKFVHHSEDDFFMYLIIKNKSSSVTSLSVTYSIDHGTLEVERGFAITLGEYYYVSGYVNSTEIEIQLNLYRTKVLCTSLVVATGRTDLTVNEEFQYDRICTHDCVLEVDISKYECVDAITTVTLISSIFGVVLVLLVIIAIWKRCWTNRNTSGTPQLPTTAQCEPFYLNTLFRSECDQEIAEIEQHHYEEIGEHQNEETENHYEEINL